MLSRLYLNNAVDLSPFSYRYNMCSTHIHLVERKRDKSLFVKAFFCITYLILPCDCNINCWGVLRFSIDSWLECNVNGLSVVGVGRLKVYSHLSPRRDTSRGNYWA